MPEPRDLLPGTVDALKAMFGDRLRCVLLTGSVAKSEWIPGWSDLDIHALVDGLNIIGLGPGVARAGQRNLGPLDRHRHQLGSLQLMLIDADRYPRGFVPPVTYELVFGELPRALTEVPAQVYWDKVDADLGSLRMKALAIASAFMSSTDAELPAVVQKVAGLLKDGLYATTVTIVGDPLRGLALRRAELLSLVGARMGNGSELRRFYALLERWDLTLQDADSLRDTFEAGWDVIWTLATRTGGPSDPFLLGRKVVELRLRRGFRNQAALADACARSGRPMSIESIGLIESKSKPYHLPGKSYGGESVLEIIAEVLRVQLVEILKWRSDDDIARSIFVHLLPEVRRRRLSGLD